MKLTDLTPNTTYYYIAGAESYYWSNEFNFTTAPPLYSDGLYRFAILGDMGSIMPMGSIIIAKKLIKQKDGLSVIK